MNTIPQKDDPKVVVTPEMEEAGFEILCDSGISDGYQQADKLLLAEIYRAMFDVSPLSPHRKLSDCQDKCRTLRKGQK